jgi:uncharacterized protein (TIGR03000 family)
MARHWFSFAAALAVGVFFVAAESAQAQQRRFGGRLMGFRDRGYNYQDPYYMGPAGNRYYYNAPPGRYIGPDGMMYTNMPGMPGSMQNQPMQPGTSTQQSFYSGVPNSVTLDVRVPSPDAQILIDGTPTRIRGVQRQYYSPPLDPGKVYTYELTAKFMEDGKEVTQTKKQEVRAGQQYTLDFTKPHHPQP